MTSKPPLAAALLTLGALVPRMALAHPGHGMGGGIVAGMLHPLTGADHLAAMLLAGAWAGMRPRGGAWLPVGFCAAMIAGFLATGTIGADVAEGLIAASVAVLAVAVLLRLAPSLAVALAGLGVFGFGHGLAHGLEQPDPALAWHFALGFLATSAALQAIGFLAVSLVLSRQRKAVTTAANG
jgi:urease accessory protein